MMRLLRPRNSSIRFFAIISLSVNKDKDPVIDRMIKLGMYCNGIFIEAVRYGMSLLNINENR